MFGKLLFILAIAICVQADTQDDAPMYLINQARYTELLARVKGPGLTQTKVTFIKAATGTFVFTCKQVWELCSCFSGDDSRIAGIEALRSNIADPQNKQIEIIEKFTFADSKKKASDLLANIVACKNNGPAPDKLPIIQLPYSSQWSDAEFNVLIQDIQKTIPSKQKLELAQKTIMGRSNGVSSKQTVLLFKQFSFTDDMIALSENVKDRLMGVSCEELKEILKVFSLSDYRLIALKTLKNSLTDVENKFSVLDVWMMSDDKEKARKIMEDLKPKSFLFGVPQGKVAFLLDYSGSMSTGFVLNTGQKTNRLNFVKSEFAKTVQSFDENIEFDVFAYAERVVAWKPQLQKATSDLIPSAIAFTKQFPANGGTNIYEALRVAWNTPRVDNIYLLTDGSPTVGKTNTDAILADIKAWYAKNPIPVHTIAFLMGTEKWDNKPASRSFMKAIADATGGTYRAIESDV